MLDKKLTNEEKLDLIYQMTEENHDILMSLRRQSYVSNAFKLLKKQGYWIFGLDGSAKDDTKLLKKYDKVVLVLGSEGEGLRNLVKENCDVLVKIPISNTDSLNVSNAAAIALYEASGSGL